MKSLKLNKIKNNTLTKEQMNAVTGGEDSITCSCGCCYVNSGGSNTGDNLAANHSGGLMTKCEPTHYVSY